MTLRKDGYVELRIPGCSGMGFRVVSRTAGLLREDARPWLFLGGRETLFQVGQFGDHITKVGENVDNQIRNEKGCRSP